MLFNLVVNWIMQRTTEGQFRSIRWTALSYMEDLDYADDLALLSYTHLHIKGKTQRLNTFVKKVGLNISSKRTEIMALNTINRRPVQIDNEELPYTDRFHPSPVEIEELTWTSRAVSDTQPEARST